MSKRSIEFFVDTDGIKPHAQQRPRFRTFKGKDTFEMVKRLGSHGKAYTTMEEVPGKTIVSAYSPASNKQAEAHVRAEFIKVQGRDFPPLEGPLEMRCVFVWPIPKSGMLKARRIEIAGYWDEVKTHDVLLWQSVWAMARKYPGVYRAKRGDLTNLVKTVEDALNDLAFKDDGQIAVIHPIKVYGPEPGCWCWLRELT